MMRAALAGDGLHDIGGDVLGSGDGAVDRRFINAGCFGRIRGELFVTASRLR